jgi:hypothetical protein
VALTKRGRGLLEHHRGRDSEHRQTFYAGADKPRERTHDTQIYRAYGDMTPTCSPIFAATLAFEPALRIAL